MFAQFYKISILTCIPLTGFYLLLLITRTDLFIMFDDPFKEDEEENHKKHKKVGFAFSVNNNNVWMFVLILICLMLLPIVNYIVILMMYAGLFYAIKINK
jgi:uncharacterized membrane protein SpoIIM required for sporulation